MPKLLLFAPCEKAIFGHDKSISLISVMHGASIKTASAEPLLAEAGPKVVPMRWAVAVIWEKLDQDAGQTFTQRVQIIDPQGQGFEAHAFEFVMDKETRQSIVNIESFPIRGPGRYLIQVSLNGEVAGESYFLVTHDVVQPVESI